MTTNQHISDDPRTAGEAIAKLFTGPSEAQLERACLSAPVRETTPFAMHALSGVKSPGIGRITRATCPLCAESAFGIDADQMTALPWIVRAGSGQAYPVDAQGPLTPAPGIREIRPFDDLPTEIVRCRALLGLVPLHRCKAAAAPPLAEWCRQIAQDGGERISAGAMLLAAISLGIGWGIAERIAQIDREPVAQARLRVRSWDWHRLTWSLCEPVRADARDFA